MDLSVLNNALKMKMGGAQNSNNDLQQGERVIDLDVDKIKPDPNQPRKDFNAEDIQALADDIRMHGLIQPIIVRTDGSGQYIVVAGERRLRAFVLLKEPKIKAIVRNDYNADKLGFIQIAENVKRSDLKFYELAAFIVEKAAGGMKQTTLADELGMSKNQVMQYMSWQDAPEFLKAARDKFNSIRAFYDMVKLSEEEPEKTEAFVAGCEERVTRADVERFKKSLKEPEHLPEPPDEVQLNLNELNENGESTAAAAAAAADADAADAEGSSDFAAEPQDDDSSTAAEFTAGSEDEDDESADITDTGDGDEAATEANDSGTSFENFEAEGADSEDAGSSEDLAETAADSSADTDNADFGSSLDDAGRDDEADHDQAAAEDEAEDDSAGAFASEDEDTHSSKLKKPLIIGSVEGREGTLLFKLRPSTDGMVWVEWEDGVQEEILAEKFRINRITEE